jgi:hypothetical protein
MTSREFKAGRHKDLSVAAWNAALIALLIGMILALVIVSSAHANENEWTTLDTSLQAAYSVVHVIDWAQTRNIIKRENEGYYEHNHLLGRKPSVDRVNIYFAATLLLHAGISRALPKDYRTPWQMFWIGVETNQISENYSIGLRAEF